MRHIQPWRYDARFANPQTAFLRRVSDQADAVREAIAERKT